MRRPDGRFGLVSEPVADLIDRPAGHVDPGGIIPEREYVRSQDAAGFDPRRDRMIRHDLEDGFVTHRSSLLLYARPFQALLRVSRPFRAPYTTTPGPFRPSPRAQEAD